MGLTIKFTGSGVDEIATVTKIESNFAPAVKVGDVIMRIDSRYFRPAEVETLLGDPKKAKQKLGWVPEISLRELCAEMVKEDLVRAQRHALFKEHGLEQAQSAEI